MYFWNGESIFLVHSPGCPMLQCVLWWSGGPRGIRSITQIQLYLFPMRLQPVACRQPQWKSWPLTAREQRVSTLTGSAVPSGTEEMTGVCVGAYLFVHAEVCDFKDYREFLDMLLLYVSGHVKWHSVCHTARWEWMTFILVRVLHISAEELFSSVLHEKYLTWCGRTVKRLMFKFTYSELAWICEPQRWCFMSKARLYNIKLCERV